MIYLRLIEREIRAKTIILDHKPVAAARSVILTSGVFYRVIAPVAQPACAVCGKLLLRIGQIQFQQPGMAFQQVAGVAGQLGKGRRRAQPVQLEQGLQQNKLETFRQLGGFNGEMEKFPQLLPNLLTGCVQIALLCHQCEPATKGAGIEFKLIDLHALPDLVGCRSVAELFLEFAIGLQQWRAARGVEAIQHGQQGRIQIDKAPRRQYGFAVHAMAVGQLLFQQDRFAKAGLVVAHQIDHLQPLFARMETQSASQLLQEDNARLRRAQHQYGIDGGQVCAFVEEVDREDDVELSRCQLFQYPGAVKG